MLDDEKIITHEGSLQCDHDWLDITTVADVESKFICSSCLARAQSKEPRRMDH